MEQGLLDHVAAPAGLADELPGQLLTKPLDHLLIHFLVILHMDLLGLFEARL